MRALCLLLMSCRASLSFGPDQLPEATVGQPYHVTITVQGGDTPVGGIYTETALPPGLTLTYDKDRRDGTASIDGTPTVAGKTSVTVEAWCYGTNRSGQTGKQSYELVVR